MNVSADEKLVKNVIGLVKIEDEVKLADVTEVPIQQFDVLMQHL